MQWWCKKEGNKGLTMIRIFFNSPILSNVKCTHYKSDKYRTVKKNSYHRCSLVPFLFTPPLHSNPIYHQLSQRECFLSCELNDYEVTEEISFFILRELVIHLSVFVYGVNNV